MRRCFNRNRDLSIQRQILDVTTFKLELHASLEKEITICSTADKFPSPGLFETPAGYSLIWAIQVSAAPKGMDFQPFWV